MVQADYDAIQCSEVLVLLSIGIRAPQLDFLITRRMQEESVSCSDTTARRFAPHLVIVERSCRHVCWLKSAKTTSTFAPQRADAGQADTIHVARDLYLHGNAGGLDLYILSIQMKEDRVSS